MYRLNQRAGDFPMLWEPHGSVTPLFTSQPHELAFSKSVSLHLHISASCPVSCLFSAPPAAALFNIYFNFLNLSTWTRAQAAQICYAVAHSRSGSRITVRYTHRQDFCLCWWIKLLLTIMIDHVWIQSDLLRSRSATDKKSPLTTLASSHRFLCCQRHPISPLHTGLGPVLFDNFIDIFFFYSSFLFFFFFCLDKHFELYIGKYCIRLQYTCG